MPLPLFHIKMQRFAGTGEGAGIPNSLRMAGVLVDSVYDVYDLAVKATYEEVVHPLSYGHLPTHSEPHNLGGN